MVKLQFPNARPSLVVLLCLLAAQHAPAIAKQPAGLDRTHRAVSLSNSTSHATLFSDVTNVSGISFVHTGLGDNDMQIGTGAAWFDYDRDGNLDLYVTRRVGANALFKNNGDGTFTEVAGPTVADAGHDGAGVAVADFNNDGWLDLYLANSDEDVLLRNNGGTGFSNITSTAGLDVSSDSRGTSATWGDYDGDGYLDLYVANHAHTDMRQFPIPAKTQDFLFRNNGDETFTDVSSLLGTADIEGTGFIGAWTDFDNDGDLDIFLVNDCAVGPVSTRLFRNDGGTDPEHWVFTEVSAEVGTDHCRAGMGIAIGDYNRDGWLDYFYSNVGPPLLLQNNGGSFTDVTTEAGVDDEFFPSDGGGMFKRWTWGANFLDCDLDGWLDLYVANGLMRPKSTTVAQPNLLYVSNGDGMTFTDASLASGCNDVDRTRTSVVGDYDGDGDADLFVVNYEENARLYRNENHNGNHYLIVELQGVISNRDGTGSRLRIRTPDGGVQYYETHSGMSLGGGDDLAAYFGLGKNTVVSELLIRWPSGLVQVLTGVAPDQRLKVVEDPSDPAVRLSAFDASAEESAVTLRWQTAFEADNAGFEVQRRKDQTFEAVEFIENTGRMFDSGVYEYRATNLPAGEHVFRLKQIDVDGSFEYSPELAVTVVALDVVQLSNAHPNPFNPLTQFTLTVGRDQYVRVEVFDVLGRRVALVHDGIVRGGTPRPFSFDAANLPSGVYLIRAKGEVSTSSSRVTLLR